MIKIFQSNFEQYINEVENFNINQDLNKYYNNLPDKIEDLNNLIIYGPPGSGKYSQSLYLLKRYSPTSLKYEKKIYVKTSKDNVSIFKISDIHFEIDFQLLGCNSKQLWHLFYEHILDIISTKINKSGVILCKNFHFISNELLEIFYSYMQNINIIFNISFFFITEHISFFPKSILNCCGKIYVSKPNVSNLKISKLYSSIDNVNNLKINKTKLKEISNHDIYYYDNVYYFIIGKNIKEFNELRILLYDILIYNLNIYNFIKYILFKLIKDQKINIDKMSEIILQTYKFFKYFNNNYRPIYHLENYILYLIIIIHEL